MTLNAREAFVGGHAEQRLRACQVCTDLIHPPVKCYEVWVSFQQNALICDGCFGQYVDPNRYQPHQTEPKLLYSREVFNAWRPINQRDELREQMERGEWQ